MPRVLLTGDLYAQGEH
ncbi:uncharacterized protein FTOL_01503 [Fusarium torulosum]|uniref:Uncharacterized protein n=1 Tax=Fusarium torulosum TaxID=33205 RepID=A0AAE8SDF8_9HYPO|nr:uncharacterized protein FTOL_01503 [Fusarium torulosum]